MNIVILGAGKTGSYAASILSKNGHSVTIVDQNAKTLQKIGSESDISTMHAPLSRVSFFETLFEKKPDLLFAATGNDETNLVSCAIAKNLGFPKTAALIHSSEYLFHENLDMGKLFYVDHFLASDLLAARDLFKILIHAGDLAIESFFHDTIQMRTIEIPSHWDKEHTLIKNLTLPEELIIGLIRRKTEEGEEQIFPHGDDQILSGDLISLVGETKNMTCAHEIFSVPEPKVKSVIIIGGSEVVQHLARFLIEQRIHVRIIERDLARCEKFADNLPEATIINRDGTDLGLLLSENVKNADALVSCTDKDSTNLLIAGLAKEAGCPRPIALISDPSIGILLERLGIIPAFSARLNTAQRLLSIVSEKNILSLTPTREEGPKIVELRIPPNSKAIGIPLSDLALPKDLLVAIVGNKNRTMIARGDTVLSPNDTIVVICNPRHLAKLHDLF
jgi:trk system potassium uptake protein TrkA